MNAVASVIALTTVAHAAYVAASAAEDAANRASLAGWKASRDLTLVDWAELHAKRDAARAAWRRWCVQREWAERILYRFLRDCGPLATHRARIDARAGAACEVTLTTVRYNHTEQYRIVVSDRGLLFI